MGFSTNKSDKEVTTSLFKEVEGKAILREFALANKGFREVQGPTSLS